MHNIIACVWVKRQKQVCNLVDRYVTQWRCNVEKSKLFNASVWGLCSVCVCEGGGFVLILFLIFLTKKCKAHFSSHRPVFEKPGLIFGRCFIRVYISYRTLLNGTIDLQVDTMHVLFWCWWITGWISPAGVLCCLSTPHRRESSLLLLCVDKPLWSLGEFTFL